VKNPCLHSFLACFTEEISEGWTTGFWGRQEEIERLVEQLGKRVQFSPRDAALTTLNIRNGGDGHAELSSDVSLSIVNQFAGGLDPFSNQMVIYHSAPYFGIPETNVF